MARVYSMPVTAVATPFTHDTIDPHFNQLFAAAKYFTDATGDTEVTPTAGSIDVQGRPNGAGGSETTDIITQGVFEEIGAPDAGGVSWASDIAERFTVGADGVITYIGQEDIDVQITGTATVEKVGGGSNEVEVRVAKNWTAGDTGYERSRAITQNATPTSVPFFVVDTITNGDNFRVILRNNSSNIDIICQVTSFVIKG